MENLTVLGAGIMGHGVAQLFAQAGKNVRIQARRESSLKKAEELITNSLKIMVEKELLTQNDMDQAIARITYTTDLLDAIQDADFILESIPEVLETKLATYEMIESAVPETTIIASNTSTFPLKELTQRAKHSERFIITHYFNPPQLVPIVEIAKFVDLSLTSFNSVLLTNLWDAFAFGNRLFYLERPGSLVFFPRPP